MRIDEVVYNISSSFDSEVNQEYIFFVTEKNVTDKKSDNPFQSIFNTNSEIYYVCVI